MPPSKSVVDEVASFSASGDGIKAPSFVGVGAALNNLRIIFMLCLFHPYRTNRHNPE